MVGRFFKNKYFIRAIASYNCIIARDIVPQDIYSIRHVYDLYKIIRTQYIKGRKGLRIKVVVILTEKPILKTILIYALSYALSIKALQKALLVSTLLSNILKAGAISSTPKKKGRLSATVAQRLSLPDNILLEVLIENLVLLIAFQWPCQLKIYLNSGGTYQVNRNVKLPHFYYPVNYFIMKA